MNPRKEQTSLTLEGVGHCAMLFNLTGSIASWPGLTIIPKYSTIVAVKVHFSSLRWRSSSIIHCRTRLVHSVWVVASGE